MAAKLDRVSNTATSRPRRLRVVLAVLGSAVLITVSAVLIAPLLTVAMGIVALLLCRVVLPLADAHDPRTDETP